MYDGCVACCPLVSHGEYADGQTDMDRQTITLCFPQDVASVKKQTCTNKTNDIIYNVKINNRLKPGLIAGDGS